MFMSVLFAWGQTEPDFDVENARATHQYFISNLPEVVAQAAIKGKANRNESFPVLSSVLDDERFILSSYDLIGDNKELSLQIAECINSFNSEFYTAIIGQNSDGDDIISIGSTKFLQVAKKYEEPLHEICEEIEEYISNGSENRANFRNNNRRDDNRQDRVVEEKQKPREDSSTADLNGKLNAHQDDNGSYTIAGFMLIILFIFGIGGVTMGIIALMKAAKAERRAQKLSESFRENMTRIDLEIKELRPSNFRGTPSPRTIFDAEKKEDKSKQSGTVNDRFNRKYQQQTNYHHQQANYQQQQAVPSQQTDNTQTISEQTVVAQSPLTKTEVRRAETYLFGNAKSGDSGDRVFYKVTRDNNGDKVFMLTLSNANDTDAEFKIAKMSDDFLRAVLNNHETYLPPIFCEKQNISANPTNIQIVSPGHAKLIDGKWMMQDRIVINLV